MNLDFGQIVAGIGKVAPAAVANAAQSQEEHQRTQLQSVDLAQRVQQQRQTAESQAIKNDQDALDKYVTDLAGHESDLVAKAMATGQVTNDDLMQMHSQIVDALGQHVDLLNQRYGRKVFSSREFTDALEARIKTALTPAEQGAAAGAAATAQAAAGPQSRPLTTEERKTYNVPANAVAVMGPDNKVQITQPPAGITVNSTPAPSPGYRNVFDDAGRVVSQEKIPGGTADIQTPQQAATTASMQVAQDSLKQFKGMLFPDGKTPDVTLLTQMALNAPFTAGREANSLMDSALQSKLRADTGAAAPDSELKNYRRMFVPNVLDNEATIRTKLTLLESFLGTTLGNIKYGVEGAAEKALIDTIGQMTIDQILQLDAASLNPDQRKAMSGRLKGLGY